MNGLMDEPSPINYELFKYVHMGSPTDSLTSGHGLCPDGVQRLHPVQQVGGERPGDGETKR